MQTLIKHSSDILRELPQKLNGQITYQSILQAFGHRAFGLVILFFALPSALPLSIIPGISAIFTIPIMIFSLQMIFGRKTLWLPKILAERSISSKSIKKMIQRTLPYLTKIEYFLRPRLVFMTSGVMEILNGVIIFCLAICLSLPIPFSNFIIAGLLMMICLGISEQDGLLVIVGYISTLLCALFIWLAVQTLFF